MAFDPWKIFDAMGHAWPCEDFDEEEVRAIAGQLGVDPDEAWDRYQAAREAAQDDAPPRPMIG